jgi:hypothetical protein
MCYPVSPLQVCCDGCGIATLEIGVQPMQASPCVQGLRHFTLHTFAFSREASMLFSPLPFGIRSVSCPRRPLGRVGGQRGTESSSNLPARYLRRWYYEDSPFLTAPLRTVRAPFNAHGSPVSSSLSSSSMTHLAPLPGLSAVLPASLRPVPGFP